MAGVAAGVVGCVAFLLIHHVWLVPIWFIAPVGIPVGAAGGAVVGMAYAELFPRLPGRPWTAFVVAGVFATVMVPGVVIAQLAGPVLAVGRGGATALLVPGAQAAVLVTVCLAATVITGAGMGALIARRRSAAVSMAVAAVASGIGPGPNVPM